MPEPVSTRLTRTQWALIAGLVALVIVPWWVAHAQAKKAERVAEPLAAKLTGRKIDVRCPGLVGKLLYEVHEGSVQFGADGKPVSATKLSKRTCAGLRTVADHAGALNFTCLQLTCDAKTERAAEAVVVLTHESMHLRGTIDEAVTECQARAHVEEAAADLGIDRESAVALHDWQATTWQSMLAPQYQGGSC